MPVARHRSAAGARGYSPPADLARLSAFAAVVLWGVSFVATKAALREISPVTLIFTRFALGVAVLFLILKLRRQSLIPPRDAWPMLAVMGFVCIFVHQMVQVHGLTLTTAVRTGWLIG
ncbi:MAG: DMT family transporter, partial [Gemmatimonadaceae bacterium]